MKLNSVITGRIDMEYSVTSSKQTATDCRYETVEEYNWLCSKYQYNKDAKSTSWPSQLCHQDRFVCNQRSL